MQIGRKYSLVYTGKISSNAAVAGPTVPSLFGVYSQSFHTIGFVPGWWIIMTQILLLVTLVCTLFICLRHLQPNSVAGDVVEHFSQSNPTFFSHNQMKLSRPWKALHYW